MVNLLIKGYLKLQSSKAAIKNSSHRAFNDSRGQITVEQVLWVIFIVVILCGIIYGFVSGWFSDLLNSMKDTTNDKLDPVVN